MALYLLSYDLRNDRDYDTLYAELDKYNAISVLESCWCFKKNNTSAKNLRDHFKNYIDADDGLWVSQIAEDINGTPQWAGFNLINNPNKL